MPVLVQTPTGEKIALDLPTGVPCSALKALLQERLAVDVSDQRLIFGGFPLGDCEFLTDEHVTDSGLIPMARAGGAENLTEMLEVNRTIKLEVQDGNSPVRSPSKRRPSLSSAASPSERRASLSMQPGQSLLRRGETSTAEALRAMAQENVARAAMFRQRRAALQQRSGRAADSEAKLHQHKYALTEAYRDNFLGSDCASTAESWFTDHDDIHGCSCASSTCDGRDRTPDARRSQQDRLWS